MRRKNPNPPRAPARDPRARQGQPAFAYVQSLERGLAVIKSFDEANPRQTVADVARATGLDRSAARRFLLTLEALGYIEHDGRHFRLAPQTLQLGYAYLASLPWWRAAQRVSERLAAKVGMSTAVGVLEQQRIFYVAYASAHRFPVLVSRSIGTQLPAAATAIGRVLLAALPPEAARAWLAAAVLEPYTPLTRTGRAEMGQALNEVRREGFALVDQELAIGLRSIGVPVFSRGGDVIAGMSVSVIEGQMTRQGMVEHYLRPLQEAAREITGSLPV